MDGLRMACLLTANCDDIGCLAQTREDRSDGSMDAGFLHHADTGPTSFQNSLHGWLDLPGTSHTRFSVSGDADVAADI
jgi:hypothetical protein